MNDFERVCDSMRVNINVEKSKVLVVKKNRNGSCENVRGSGEEMQEWNNFNYLGVTISTDGGMGEEVVHRVPGGRKEWGTKAKM